MQGVVPIGPRSGAPSDCPMGAKPGTRCDGTDHGSGHPTQADSGTFGLTFCEEN